MDEILGFSRQVEVVRGLSLSMDVRWTSPRNLKSEYNPMENTAALHPTDDVLSAYGVGKLDDESARSVDAHLATCPDCCGRVAAISSDSFLGRLRDAEVRPPTNGPAVSATDGLSLLGAAPVVAAPPAAGTIPRDLAEHPGYEVIRELGRGGMGVVYLARNKLMGRLEVLKVVGGHLISRPAIRERFLREIRSAAQLHHPNIVTAYTALPLGESLVFSMEYVDGPDLARVVKARGPLVVAHACNFAYQAALGLQHAHERGMVHRDIKPANLVLAREGKKPIVKILDFGLAKVSSEDQRDSALTREGQMLGTPDYIAPEQIRNAQSADIRADIYSLGCTLYCLLSGGPPFTGEHPWDVYQAHFSMDASPLNLARPEVPVELAALVAKMMAKEPRRRFQEPKEVAQALVPFFRPGHAGLIVAGRGASTASTSRAEPAPAEPVPGPSRPPTAPPAAPPVGRPATGQPASIIDGLIDLGEPEPIRDSLPDAPVRRTDAGSSIPQGAPLAKRLADGLRGPRRPLWWAVAGVSLLGLAIAWASVMRPAGPANDVIPASPAPASPAGAALATANPSTPSAPGISGDLTPLAMSSGEWKTEGKELVQADASRRNCTLTFGEDWWADCDFTVDAMRVGGSGSFSMLVHNTGNDNEFAYTFSDENGGCQVVSRQPGNSRVLSRFDLGLHDRKWYTARVHVRGGHFACSLYDPGGGSEIFRIDVEDGRHPGGRVGLQTFGGMFRFRNIRVTSPDGKTLWDGPPVVDSKPDVVPPRNAPADASHFLGKHYKVFTEYTDWHEARDRCKRMGGQLAIVRSEAENRFITSLLKKAGLESAWLGATDEEVEGRWAWVDDSELLYHNWDGGGDRPNHWADGGLAEDYLIIRASRDGAWWDYLDSDRSHFQPGLVCEWPADATASLRQDKVSGTVGSSMVDLDRVAAERVLRLGSEITVRAGNRSIDVERIDQLPSEPFSLERVSFWGNRRVNDGDLACLKGLTQLRTLSLGGTLITDAALDYIVGLRSLETLHLGAINLSDAGLRRVEGLDQLSLLFLGNSSVTDAGLKHLVACRQLRTLLLDETAVSDACIDQLVAMPSLQEVHLNKSRVTEAGVERLRKAQPEMSIKWSMEGRHSATTDGLRSAGDRAAKRGTAKGSGTRRPPGRPRDAMMFRGKYYKVFPVQLSWHEARWQCENLGGHLANVTDEQQNRFLTRLVADHGLDAAWLGATDERVEGRWGWVDGSTMNYTNWDPAGRQPNNKQGLEHYLILWVAHDGKWSDQPANSVEHSPGFVCQWD